MTITARGIKMNNHCKTRKITTENLKRNNLFREGSEQVRKEGAVRTEKSCPQTEHPYGLIPA